MRCSAPSIFYSRTLAFTLRPELHDGYDEMAATFVVSGGYLLTARTYSGAQGAPRRCVSVEVPSFHLLITMLPQVGARTT